MKKARRLGGLSQNHANAEQEDEKAAVFAQTLSRRRILTLELAGCPRRLCQLGLFFAGFGEDLFEGSDAG